MIIYLVRNLINGRCYIGQTTQTLDVRWKQHQSRSSCCRYLKHAINFYGESNFEILEIASALDADTLNELETGFIKIYNCLAPKGYNLNSGGKDRFASSVTRKKMSKAKKGRPRPELRGKPPWNKGLKTGPQSEARIAHRIEAATQAKYKPILCLETGKEYPSSKAASIDLEINQGNISSVLNGKRPHVGGLTFKFN